MNSECTADCGSLETNFKTPYLLSSDCLQLRVLISSKSTMRLMWNKLVHHTKEQIRNFVFFANNHFWTHEQPEPVRTKEKLRSSHITLRRTVSSQLLLEETVHTGNEHDTRNLNLSTLSEKSEQCGISIAESSSYVVRRPNNRRKKIEDVSRSRVKQSVLTCRSRTFSHREMLLQSNRFSQSPFCLAAYHNQWDDFELLLDIGFDLNAEQTFYFEQADLEVVCVQFRSVIDLFLHVMQQNKSPFQENCLITNSSVEPTVFPQLLSMMLNKGADVCIQFDCKNDTFHGGIHFARLNELFHIASKQLSARFSIENYQEEDDVQIDTAGIVRQLIQSGLQVPLHLTHISGMNSSNQYTSNLYVTLIQCLALRHKSSARMDLSARLQSFVILWLNVVYSGTSHHQTCSLSIPRELEKNALISAYHNVFQQFIQPPRLFILARQHVRQMIGTRWFRPIVTDSLFNPDQSQIRNYNLHSIERIQAIRIWLNPLSDSLRRALTYLEANEVRHELKRIEAITE